MSGSEKRALVAQLSSFESFATCPRGDVEALVEAGRTVALPASWAFVREGTPADACYVLLVGTARVFHDQTVIAELGPGDVIGEMALLSGGQRNATVSSTSAVRALRIENDALAGMLVRRPALREALVAVRRRHTVADQPTTAPS
jgi:CRP/FNR family cyclic AMP-dependent transcriptional regulator